MAPYRFRLARVLDWYSRQSQIEQERLRLCNERAIQAKANIERHLSDVLARQTELVHSSKPQASELAALEPFRRAAKQQEARLRENCIRCENALDNQRTAALAAQRRLRLLENLSDRRLAEYRYEADRQLEELASDSHLAGLARALTKTQL